MEWRSNSLQLDIEGNCMTMEKMLINLYCKSIHTLMSAVVQSGW
jgi:hypothetical protein